MNIKGKQIVALTAMPLVALSMSAQAATVLIDFSNATPAVAGADSNGNFWTTVGNSGLNSNAADLSVTNLIDSTNAPTTIGLSVDFSNNGANGWGGNAIMGAAGSNPFDQTFATTDGIYSNTTAGLVTLTFSGLGANSAYNLSLIGGRNLAGMDGPITMAIGSGSGGTLKNNGTQLDFPAVSNASGVIAFTFVDTNASNLNSTTLNAMRLVAVPEPSKAALLGLGGLALIMRRRR